MFDRLKDLETRYRELEGFLGGPHAFSKPALYQKYAKEHSELQQIVYVFRQYEEINSRIAEGQELLKGSDEELKAIVREELPAQRDSLISLEKELRRLLMPKDPNDEKNVLLEIRAGTGGDEAALFAADLLRMYARYSDVSHWKTEVMSCTPGSGMGGYKEVIALISGRGAYSRLKFESGVHRVQRVPVTEAQGRIHTSAVTVAVLPEVEEVELTIDPNELRIDVYRSTGHGGQSVNTTDSAVRITHLPTNLVVTCQDEKSQLKNKAKAMKVLRARLLDAVVSKQQAEISETRKSQVGSGDRSERIRTYNFPQGRVTDHRINMTLYNLEQFLNGEIGEVIDSLVAHFQAESLNNKAEG
ncbi:MAG: peptide chain release factor 1 [Smithellaceae bacterium]|nr:peptide chain release factor 1 [Smithellaceae bacterium]